MPKLVICDRCNHIADDSYDNFLHFAIEGMKGNGEDNPVVVDPPEHYLCQTCYADFKRFMAILA